MRVEIWSDIACPWCYIGKARFEKGLAAFAHGDEVEVVHRSFELDPNLAKGSTAPVLEAVAKKYGRTLDDARTMEKHAASTARAEGLGYLIDRDLGNTFDIHRLLHLARARGRHSELLNLAYRANFAEERSVYDHEVLVQIAVEAGLDESETRAVLADESAYADEVRADELEAAQLGARSVPFFVIDRRYGVSGGQRPEVFTQALEQAWQEQERTIVPVGMSEGDADTAACGPDGACAVPSRD
ncbi:MULTISPECIES: DsbA family oxidoreductase [Streptomyces]|uniref:DsbA family oxidoreductase n=1 Tax=Streptomyces TaxID=1883 RepID=UPI0006ADCDD6|nr:DsbA family oxidoreductase [Streptomyces sp. AS58]KOV53342.1 protein-disulfide isomerase [Streptomyces sp. AS58]